MIEDSEILSLNSHETVLQVSIEKPTLSSALLWFKSKLDDKRIAFPQIVHSEFVRGKIELFVTGAAETTNAIVQQIGNSKEIIVRELACVTATCRGTTRPETLDKIVGHLEATGIRVLNMLVSAISITVILEKAARIPAIQILHGQIPQPPMARSIHGGRLASVL